MTRAQPYNRAAAIEAAMTLFWEKGFHATSLKDLEAALQMKPGSIYAAFKSKEGLYLAALSHYGDLFLQQLKEVTAASETPLNTLANVLRAQVASEVSATPQACMVVKTMLDNPLADGPIGEAARAQYDAMRAVFADLFRQAQHQGQLPPDADPDTLATRYQMAVGALRIEAQRAPGDPQVLALAEAQAQEIEALAATS